MAKGHVYLESTPNTAKVFFKMTHQNKQLLTLRLSGDNWQHEYYLSEEQAREIHSGIQAFAIENEESAIFGDGQ